MAYKKRVQGRMYPFLYNVTNTVGSRKKVVKQYKMGYRDAEILDFETHKPTGKHMMVPTGMERETHLYSSYEPNKRDDVMLVQYLLKRVYQQGYRAQPPLKSGVGDPHSPAELMIDGIYGPGTQHAIEQFQLEMRRNGQNIATDGCVDPEKGQSSTASISKTGYTISWLNKYFWVLYPQLAPDIRIDPECPLELKQAVSGGSV